MKQREHPIVKTKNVLTVVLLLFVAASVITLIASGLRARADNTGASSDAVSAEAPPNLGPGGDAEQPERRVIAYYFHNTYRCTTCLTIEQYANEALTTGFAEELQSGVLEWRVINVEEPANQHFIEDYQLTTQSLVLVEMEGENQVRWQNLGRVWDFVHDRAAFFSYVQDETRAYLAESR